MGPKIEAGKRPGITAENIIARIERLPYSSFHTKLRVIVGIAFFFDAIDYMSLSTVLPVIGPMWHIPPNRIGLLISISFVGNALGAFVCGWLAEKYGRMRVLILTVAIFSAASFCLAFTGSYRSFLVFRAIQGFGLGGELPISAAFVSEWAKAKGRGRFYMVYNLTYLIGALAGSYLGTWIVPTFGWRTMFFIGAVPAALTVVLRYAIPESPRWLAAKGRLAEADQILTKLEERIAKGGKVILPPVIPLPVPVAGGKTKLLELFQGVYLRRTLVLWAISFGGAFLNLGFQIWLPTILRTVYKLPLHTALMYGVYFSGAVLISNALPPLFIDRIGRRAWYTLSFLIGSILYFIIWILHPPGAWGLTAFMLLVTICVASPMGVTMLYMAEIYPTRIRTLGGSTSRIFYAAASMISPILIGFVVQGYGIFPVFLIFAVTSLVLGLIALIFAVETRGRVLEEVSA